MEKRELLAVTPISFDSALSQIVIRGGAADDSTIVSMPTASTIHVSYESGGQVSEATFQRSAVTSIDFAGSFGNDRFENLTDVTSRAVGGSGDDVLIGGSGVDNLLGNLGNDELIGNQGNDVLSGHEGNDQINGGDGDDVATGGVGDDLLVGGAGNDQLTGNEGNDDLQGDDGIDQLLGLDGDDLLSGGSGNDNLQGGIGIDRLFGNSGDDVLSGQDGNDRLYAHDGNDELIGGLGDDLLVAGEGNDQLTGNEGRDEAYGDGGNDRLVGLAGDDYLSGGAGNDVLIGGADNDELNGGEGDDELSGDEGNDRLLGLDGIDVLNGGLGDDYLSGGAGNDQISGNEGHDELRGDDGNDQLYGLDGDDLVFGGIGDDLILGGSGNDRLTGDVGNDELRGEVGNDQLYGLLGDDIMTGGVGNDFLWGGAGNDQITGDEGDDELQGEAGNDRLFGLDGDDRLIGGVDSDYLLGGLGNDRLYGSSGNDELNGQEGNDRLYGQTGNDILSGGVGDDLLVAGAGNDRLTGHDGNDQLYGEDGNDSLYGLAGDDVINGGAGNDVLLGDLGNDQLFGATGNDQLNGDEGNDALAGGDGDDLLDGGVSNDVLIGGAGRDELMGQWGEDILVGGTTSYDNDGAKLSALVTAWSSAVPYATRIQQIENAAFSTRLMSTETVFDDGVADAVFGSDGQDWFFQTGSLAVFDPTSGQSSGLEGFDLVSALDLFSDRQESEAIQSKLPHASDSDHQREHLTLFQLVRYDQVTHYAVQSGAWSDPTTWQNGVVPGTGAKVLISKDVAVQVDTTIPARLATIRVDGTLSFDVAVDTELRVDTIVVAGSGLFEMGSENAPIQANVTARLLITNDGPIDRTVDPYGISRGLLSHGSVSIFGAEVTSYVALASLALVGSTQLAFEEVPIGWKVGDTIVVASTTAGTQQNEVRQITAILGNLVALNQPLSYNHIPARADFDVHVANVTRNAVIESESTEIDRRGHAMFMHNRDVNIAYAGFYRLGRTNKMEPINDPVVNSDWSLEPGTGTNPRSRYPVHFHRNGSVNDGNPAVVRGSAVVDAPGWGFVNHSSYVDILDNVAFDVKGAAFSTEVGEEIGSFRGNIAIGSVGSGESINSREMLQDFGHQGDGFWFQGGGISVTDNVSAGNDGHAFVFYTRGLIEGGEQRVFLAENLPHPEIANGATTIEVEQVPIFQFERNAGYASETGLTTRYQLRDASHPLQQSFLEDSVFWNNTTGINLAYAQRIVLRNVTVAHTPGAWPPIGIEHNAITKDITFDNVSVMGYAWGIAVPRLGYAIINGGYFANRNDIVVQTGLGADRSVLITGPIQLGALGAENQAHVYMRAQLTPLDDWSGFIFSRDVVTLNYGPYGNQRVYYTLQHATAVPVPAPVPYLPAEYVGLTNQQLWGQFGIALGGEIAPSNAYTIPSIIGLIAP